MSYVTSWERIAKKEGIKLGEKLGEKRGEKKGEEKNKLNTAMAMIKKGLNLDLIAEVTGFPTQRIQQLAAEGAIINGLIPNTHAILFPYSPLCPQKK